MPEALPMSQTDDLREGLARFIMEHSTYVVKEQAEWRADALIRGPLAPILAQVSALQAEVEGLKAERDEAREAFMRVAEAINAPATERLDLEVRDRLSALQAETRDLRLELAETVQALSEADANHSVAEAAYTEARALAQRAGEERDRAAADCKRLDALLDAGDRLLAAERAESDARDLGEEIQALNVAASHAGQRPNLDAARRNYDETSLAIAVRNAAERELHNALAIACASRAARSVIEPTEGEDAR